MNTKQLITALRKHHGHIYADVITTGDAIPIPIQVVKADILHYLHTFDGATPALFYFNIGDMNMLYLHAAGA